MTNPLISVIVPVYNVERYLHCCIDSILGQTFRNFELLLVNDGSKDGSGAICNEYLNDSRVKVYHIPNGGANNARYKGLQESRGEFVMFVDSDDTISHTYIETFFKEICNSDASIAIRSDFYDYKHVCKYDYMIDMFRCRGSRSMCDKIYRRNVIVSSFKQFPKSITMGEDLLQSVIIADSCNNVLYFKNEQIKYHYTINATSVSNTFINIYSYEKLYWNFFEQIIKIDQAEVRKAMLFSKINGMALIILSGNKVDYNDEYFYQCKLEFNRLKLKSPEGWILFNIQNKSLCRSLISLKRVIVAQFSAFMTK